MKKLFLVFTITTFDEPPGKGIGWQRQPKSAATHPKPEPMIQSL